MLALSQDAQQNRPVEAREHIRRFHELFFTLSPDKDAIESNVGRALYLSDESAIGYYRNLQEKGYFNRMIAGNISQTLTVDSIQGNFNSYPYEMKTYSRQHIIRSVSYTHLRAHETKERDPERQQPAGIPDRRFHDCRKQRHRPV